MSILLRRGGLALFAVCVVLVLWNGSSPPPPAYAVESYYPLSWAHVYPPQAGTHDVLNAVYALRARDIWAVGSTNDTSTLTEHWNGSAWNIVASPNAASGTSTLLAVYGSAANDVWAVGRNRISDTESRALLMHWDGSAWSLLPEPMPGTDHWLADITGSSADNVWAVGTYREGVVTKNLVLHWDGTLWTQSPIGIPPQIAIGLNAVAIISPDDIWAAGAGIYHWNGSAWSMQYDIAVADLAAFGHNDVWFVGPGIKGFLHRSGAQWQTLPPGQSLYVGNFTALAGAASDDIYAVGSAYAHGSLGVIQHYNGAQWKEIASPATGRNTYLNGVSVVSSANVWLVGSFKSYLPPDVSGSVILHGTLPPLPQAPKLVSPPNHSTVSVLHPILTWRSVKNAARYRVQIQSASGAWKTNADVAGTSYKTPKLAHNTTYRWRVRACDAARCGPWSDEFELNVN